jgi:hypothetical protein
LDWLSFLSAKDYLETLLQRVHSLTALEARKRGSAVIPHVRIASAYIQTNKGAGNLFSVPLPLQSNDQNLKVEGQLCNPSLQLLPTAIPSRYRAAAEGFADLAREQVACLRQARITFGVDVELYQLPPWQ